MKRYLLFTIALIFGWQFYLTAQVAATNTSINAVEEDEFYETDCEHKAAAAAVEEDFSNIFDFNRKREEPLRIYPNPTTEFISVTDNSSVAYLYVYNIIGRRVKSFPVFSGGQYSLRDLPDGMYLIGMADEQGKIMKTVRTSKSMPRP